jgi:hypothetical protein
VDLLTPAFGPPVFCGKPHFPDLAGKSTAYDSITAAIAPDPWPWVAPEIAPMFYLSPDATAKITRRASTSRPGIPTVAPMTVRIRSFMQSAG